MPTKRPTSPEVIEQRRQRYQENSTKFFTCNVCGEKKLGSEFYIETSRTTAIAKKCKTCVTTRLREHRSKWSSATKAEVRRVHTARRAEKAKAIRSELVSGGCIICGETEPCCMNIHHLDPSTKEVNFSDIICAGRVSKLRKEIAKGVAILCANCHAKVHAGILSLP